MGHSPAADRSPGSSCQGRASRIGELGIVKRLRLHLATALLALLGILPGSLSQTTSSLQNPYDGKVAELRRNFVSARPPEQAVVLAREYSLRTYVSDRSSIRSWFGTVAND